MRLATSSCNPAWHEHRSITDALLHSRVNAFCHSRLQTRIAAASHHIDQRSVSVGSADSTTQIPRCSHPLSFSRSLNRALATVWCTFGRPHLPKVPRAYSEKQILD